MTMNEQQKADFKTSKQRLSKAQLAIKKDLKEGRLPQPADADRFIAMSREMDRLCQAEWRAAMDIYMEHIKTFQHALEGGQLQAVEAAFHGLLDSKVDCHKAFRRK